MKIRALFNRLSLFWVLQISGWTVYGYIYYLMNYALSEKPLDLRNIIGFALTWLAAFLVTLLLREIYHRLFEHTKQLAQIAWAVLLGSALGSLLWLLVDRTISIPLWGMEQFWKWMREPLFMQVRTAYFNAFLLLTWSALYFFIKFWREWSLERDRSEKARLLANTAQLQMLRYQLNPHFLFNSLNSIRALVEEDQNKARETITELAELLRYSLTSQNNGDVPLARELEAIRHYFAIEEKRYEDNLETIYEIEPATEEQTIPSFLLHPLVENAVKYGMQTSTMPLQIRIRTRLVQNTLEICIWNSGKWLAEDSPQHLPSAGTGTGITNIRQRLETAYPGRYDFEIGPDENGVSACIRIRREAR